MGNDVPREMSTLAQNEVTFAVLRDSAIDGMLAEGKTASYRSTITRTADGGMSVQTSGAIDPMLKNFSIAGTVEAESVAFNPMESGMRLPSFGTHLVGNYGIRNGQGQLVERSKFEFFSSEKNYQFDRADLATIAITRTDAKGNSIQMLNPALSEEKFEGGRFVYDSNGQPVRVASLSEGAANCGRENIANPSNRRRECNWLVDDASLNQTYSYNQTLDGTSRRSVVRVGETPRAIVHQRPEFDASGNLIAINTSIRPIEQLKR